MRIWYLCYKGKTVESFLPWSKAKRLLEEVQEKARSEGLNPEDWMLWEEEGEWEDYSAESLNLE